MPHYTFFSLSLSLSLYASFKLEHTLFLLSDFSFSVSNVFSTHTPNWYVNALTHSLTSKELHSLTLARSLSLCLSLSLSHCTLACAWVYVCNTWLVKFSNTLFTKKLLFKIFPKMDREK